MKAFRNIGESHIQIIQPEKFAAAIVDFWVDPEARGTGVGRRLLVATCRDADREKIILLLEPCPFGMYDIETEMFQPPTMTYKQLCAFYRSFGFRFRPKPLEDQMMRKPK